MVYAPANSLRNAVIAIGDVRMANLFVITQYDAFPSSSSISAMMITLKDRRSNNKRRKEMEMDNGR